MVARTSRYRRRGIAINSPPENVTGQVIESSQRTDTRKNEVADLKEERKSETYIDADNSSRNIEISARRWYRLTSLEFIVVSSTVFISCDPVRCDVFLRMYQIWILFFVSAQNIYCIFQNFLFTDLLLVKYFIVTLMNN